MSVITLNFEGYAQCRLATDPDPTDERRGVSGYTFALPGEPDLDWTIYTQPGPGVVSRIGVDDRMVGVKVTSGFCGTQPIVKGHPLYDAPVFLDGGPRFEERNYIVTQQTFGVIYPFRLRIAGNGIELYRTVDWYPGKPLNTDLMEIPQHILQPYTSQFVPGYPACLPLLGPSQNASVYRAERLRRLEEIAASSRFTPDGYAAIQKRMQQLRIDDPRDRRTGQLRNAATWNYALNGPASWAIDPKKPQWLNGSFDAKQVWKYHDPSRPLQPWPCSFWTGSWDADSLTFYMGGTLSVYDLGTGFDEWLKTGGKAATAAADSKGAKKK